MSIKMIALDMDRTTLDAEGRLSEETKAALEYAIAKDVHIVIASGRSFSALPTDVMAVEGIEYAITCNGAEVYYIPEKKCLRSFCLSEEAVEAVMELTKDASVTYEGFIRGQAYAAREYVSDPVRFGAGEKVVDYVQRTRVAKEDIRGFLLAHKQELNSMDIIVKDPLEKQRIWELLCREVPDVYITSSVAQLIEISDKRGGKHSGVKCVAEVLGIRQEEIAAFGDADNDIDMLLYAGVGVAVENASENCLKAADMIVPHHDKDGVAKGIYQLLKEGPLQ
ncbi:MAG: HAD family phosphatase [Lachnospiraceae bacterium]|nr:HAD family phosphatase [Lachnospiraceae bacterium]